MGQGRLRNEGIGREDWGRGETGKTGSDAENDGAGGGGKFRTFQKETCGKQGDVGGAENATQVGTGKERGRRSDRTTRSLRQSEPRKPGGKTKTGKIGPRQSSLDLQAKKAITKNYLRR